MRLTILGSGTAAPNGSRNSAGYFVETADASVMLDCGAGTVHALARYGLPWERMTHLFVSHFHVDHIGELASLFFAFKWGREVDRDRAITVIGPHGLDQIMDGLDRTLGPRLFEPGFPVDVALLNPGERLSLSPEVTLAVAKTPHTRESLAARIESRGRSICYTGDTGYSDELADFFRGADLLVSECSFLEKREGVAHLSVDEVAAMAERAAVARLVVTHFYFPADDRMLHARIRNNYSGEVIVGTDGAQFEL
ncbi:MAG TPA: ribonuclease Z [Blastocatellia bacterium]|nr:ribonuclease Z [Blastocatellia bacterium]